MWLTVSQGEQMVKEKRCEILGRPGTPLRKIRFVTPEPDMSGRVFDVRKASIGTSHQQERRDNPKGVWTIDRMPRAARGIFLAVVTDCLRTDRLKEVA
jgi:hypothetical protein